MSERTAFINARLIDPATGRDEKGALLVENGVIADIGPRLFNDGVPQGTATIDCGGHVLAPALIDMPSSIARVSGREILMVEPRPRFD